MLKKIIMFGFVFLCSFLGYVFADLGGYTIDDYHVDMKLNENASMNVEETIQVNFSEYRHGIYRDIPLKQDGNNQNHSDIVDVSVDGGTIADKSIQNDTLSIKIGDADKTIIGPKKYIIKYTVNNAIGVYSGWTELYRNVIGTERLASIKKASWTILLPKGYAFDTTGIFAMRGGYGSKNIDNINFQKVSDIERQGSLDVGLLSNQGITVGMKFSPDYFSFPQDYVSYSTPIQLDQNLSESVTFDDDSMGFIPYLAFFLIFFFSMILKLFKFKGFFISHPWKSKKPLTIYYDPPNNIEPCLAFYMWYNNPKEAKIFIAMVYYWAVKGWAVIKKVKGGGLFGFFQKDEYHIIETSNDPKGATDLDKVLLQGFFGIFDSQNDDIKIDQESYVKVDSLLLSISTSFSKASYTQKKPGWLGRLGYLELNDLGSDAFEHLRGYEEYLKKVEKPVIEQELKSDPDFINKIIPRAVLFGVETRLLKMVEDLLSNVNWYHSDDGTMLTYATFAAMSKSFKTYSYPPSSSGGGFGSGGGFSGGGGGGGGGGSW